MNLKRKKKVSSSYIPDHLSFSILSRLPVKSLKRFSCVRKSWSLLIQNPNFMTIYRNNLICDSHPLYEGGEIGLVLNQFVNAYDCNIYLISGNKFEKKVKLDLPIRVLGSAINGVICIYDCDGPATTTALWNPATEETVFIPSGHAEFKPEFTTSIFPHGFGYDHVADDYKVIQHVNYYIVGNENRLEENPMEGNPMDENPVEENPMDENPFDDVEMPDPFWEIYSLKSNSWRKLDFDMPRIYLIFNSDVYFNGVCHWLGAANNLVVSFELCNEDFFLTPTPFEGMDDDLEVSLILLNDSVAIITNCKNTTSFQISILGEFCVEDSWIKLFNVELSPCIEHPIGAGEKGNIFFRKDDGELVCFDLTNGLIEEIGIKGERRWCQIAIYKKNLRLIGDIKM